MLLRILILLINREWGHHREIADWGLDVLTERYRNKYNNIYNCVANRRRKVQQRRSSTRSNRKHIYVAPGSRYTAHAWLWSTATASWNQLHAGFCWGMKTGVAGEKPSEQGREPRQTQPTYAVHSGNRTRVILVGGECSHLLAIPAISPDSEVNTKAAEVWDFPVMTERTRLISYLLYGSLLKSKVKKNCVAPEVVQFVLFFLSRTIELMIWMFLLIRNFKSRYFCLT